MKINNSIQTEREDTQQAGFTIVELLIATTVFSMVLMVILYGVLSFSHAYYSGLNSSSTQNTTRSIVNDVSQAIEFSGNNITAPTAVSGNTYYFCAGGATYYYTLGQEYNGEAPSVNPGLYMLPGKCGALTAADFSNVQGKELLAPNMRITYLSLLPVAGSQRLFTLGMSLAYGDSDMLCRQSLSAVQPGGCQQTAPYYPQAQSVIGTSVDDVSCRHATGYQYCAHAGLTTTVSLRVANGALGQ